MVKTDSLTTWMHNGSRIGIIVASACQIVMPPTYAAAPTKHSATTSNQISKTKLTPRFNLKEMRYWELLGKSKSEAIKYLCPSERSMGSNYTLCIYKDYAYDDKTINDIKDYIELIFKDDRVAMVRSDCKFFLSGAQWKTKWFNADGIVSPQPVLNLKDEKPLLIQDGIDLNSYYDAMRSEIKKHFHSLSACNGLAIMVEIAPDGSVSETEVRHTSGDPAIDKEAVDAIKASKFPPRYGPNAHTKDGFVQVLPLKQFLMQTTTP